MRMLLVGIGILIAAQTTPARGEERQAPPDSPAKPGESIVVCGQKIPIGTRVILWSDPGGFNAYVPGSPSPADSKAEPKAASPGFGQRKFGMSEAQLAEVAKNGWTLPLLQQTVDQFVIHYDVCGTSERCFNVLNNRGLSVQFMLDLDGTIYQTLDLKENAWHATKANSRSVGIEIANMGAYPDDQLDKSHLADWYKRDEAGHTEIVLPDGARVPTRTAGAAPLRPIRDEPVVGKIQGQKLTQYDLTPQQYAALAKLTAGLCATFPKIKLDVPRDERGQVVDHVLDKGVYDNYHGILGHFHVQENKTDPGPAFQWDRVLKPTATPARP